MYWTELLQYYIKRAFIFADDIKGNESQTANSAHNNYVHPVTP
jgi:hypothetical protein